MTIQLEQRLLTVNEYQQMVAAGILDEDDRVELLNGQLIKMSPSGSKHAACVEKITAYLRHLLDNKTMIRSQNPIILGHYSEPEPDIAVVLRKDNYYADHHPIPGEIYFLVEVSDTSSEKDRQVKSAIYAAAQIPEYWIVNLAKQEIEVYQQPEGDQYQSKQTYSKEDEIHLSDFNLSLSVKALLV